MERVYNWEARNFHNLMKLTTRERFGKSFLAVDLTRILKDPRVTTVITRSLGSLACMISR